MAACRQTLPASTRLHQHASMASSETKLACCLANPQGLPVVRRDQLRCGYRHVRRWAVGANDRVAWLHAQTCLSPNMLYFSAAISACEEGKQWERALVLLEERAVRTSAHVARSNAQELLDANRDQFPCYHVGMREGWAVGSSARVDAGISPCGLSNS